MIFIDDFLNYCRHLFVEAWQKIFTLFDVLGILLFFYPELAFRLTNDIGLIRSVASAIVFLSFFLANFSLYRKLTDQLSYEADIRLEVLEREFNNSFGSRNSFRELHNPHGFNSDGMPDWASLWARIRVANIGHESGRLILEIDQEKTKLPALFDLEEAKVDFLTGQSISGRKSSTTELYFDVPYTERNPIAFASYLKSLKRPKRGYKIVLSYRTQKINTISPVRKLTIKGDFQHLYDQICKYWQDYGFRHLVERAK